MYPKVRLIEKSFPCACGAGTITSFTKMYPGNTSGPPERCYETEYEDAGCDACETCGNEDPYLTAQPSHCQMLHRWSREKQRMEKCGAPTFEDSWFCQQHLEAM